MIKLKDLLGERTDSYYAHKNQSQLFPHGADEKVQIRIVISHKKGITPEEGAAIVKAFDRDDKHSDLKYYPATKKVVGKVGVFRFFMPGKVTSATVTGAVNLDRARLKHELDRIKPGLEIIKKSGI